MIPLTELNSPVNTISFTKPVVTMIASQMKSFSTVDASNPVSLDIEDDISSTSETKVDLQLQLEVDFLKSRLRQYQQNQMVLELELRKVSESIEQEKLLRVRLNQERDILHEKLETLTTFLAEQEVLFRYWLKLREKYSTIFASHVSANICSHNETVVCAGDNNLSKLVGFFRILINILDLSLIKEGHEMTASKSSLLKQALNDEQSDYRVSAGTCQQLRFDVCNRLKPPTVLGKVPVQKDVPIKLLMGPEYVQKSPSMNGSLQKIGHHRNRYNFTNIAHAFGISYESMTDDQRLAFRNAICQRYSREYKRRKRIEESRKVGHLTLSDSNRSTLENE